MQRYHFNFVQDGVRLDDVEGAEFRDADAARGAAIHDIRAMIAADIIETGTLWLSRRIDVTAADGAVVCRVAFAAAVMIDERPDVLP